MSSQTAVQVHARTNEQSLTQSVENTSAPMAVQATPNRVIIRYSFQFYAEQIDALKRLRAQPELQGRPQNLYELAREAFSAYLKRVAEKGNE